MRTLFTCLLLLIFSAGYSQKYALIKMTSMTPVKFADTITKRDIRDDRFPIERQNIDSVLIVLKDIQERLKSAKYTIPEFTFKRLAGNIIFTGIAAQQAYGVRINVTMSTKVNDRNFGMYLCKSTDSNNANIKKIEKLIGLLADWNAR